MSVDISSRVEKEIKAYIAKQAAGEWSPDLYLEPRYTVKDTSQSYRSINHWSEMGLVGGMRFKDSGWRKFSFVELAWIEIISELRSFGLPIQSIQNLKEDLLDITLYPGQDFTLMSFAMEWASNW